MGHRLGITCVLSKGWISRYFNLSSVDKYFGDCLLLFIGTCLILAVDLNRCPILEGSLWRTRHELFSQFLTIWTFSLKLKLFFFYNWEMIKIGVVLLGSGLHKSLGTFHDFLRWNIHRLGWFAWLVNSWLGLVFSKIVEPDDDGTYRIKHQMPTNRKGSFRGHFRSF